MSLREGERVYNSQVFLGPAGVLGTQHKVHLLGSDRSYDLGGSWDVVDVDGWKIGTNICFDAEVPGHFLAVRRADTFGEVLNDYNAASARLVNDGSAQSGRRR